MRSIEPDTSHGASLPRRSEVFANSNASCELTLVSSTFLQIALAVAILGGAAVITHLFARAMYVTCPNCRTLNARRRDQCRKCGHSL